MSNSNSLDFSPLGKAIIDKSYSDIVDSVISETDRVYVTGGSLILAIAKHLNFDDKDFNSDKTVVVAGKEFSVRGLWFIWKFYSVLNFSGFKFSCVDERLMPNTSDSGIHEYCGACAASTEILGKSSGSDVEDYALQILERRKKQEILPEIKDEHVSVGMIISCGEYCHSLSDENKEQRLHGLGDIPFHVSFPVEKIDIFAENLSSEDKELFIKTLVDWNCGIVLRIIAGAHNYRAGELKEVGLHVALLDSKDGPYIEKLIFGIKENISEVFKENIPELVLEKETKQYSIVN